MKNTKPLSSIILGLVITFQTATQKIHASDQLEGLLENRGAELLQRAVAGGTTDSKKAFREFVHQIVIELEKKSDSETSRRLLEALTDPSHNDFPKTEFAWIIHTFAREFYKDEIVRTTGELIRFRTYASGVPNRLNPDFIKQKEYLRDLATRLGLHFNDVDGYVQEIWIGDATETFGIMSHSDVQPVEPAEWSHDPWSGEVIDGSIWGRGSVDDKGPICAVMYGMRALLDSGFPLKKKIVLLVGTDEESANEDVETYLKTHAPPDQTIVVDSNFPVVCAEKGWGGIWLSLPRGVGNMGGNGLRIVKLQSGFSGSIVPEKATAHLIPAGIPLTDAVDTVRTRASNFMKSRKGSRLEVTIAGDTIVVTAIGKSVHSAVPATGHNALMDILVFLYHDVRPLENDIALMAKFAATYIGFELDGRSLGIAHHDDFMGDLTVAGNMFSHTDTTVTFMFNFRAPRGIGSETIEKALQTRFDEFGKANGVTFSDTRYVGTPLYTDPESPFVQRLLKVYNRVTHESRKAQSIGGGTYAKRIPNAVVFGPALPDEEYLGHQPDEHLKINTLVKNIEILTHTMVDFGM